MNIHDAGMKFHTGMRSSYRVSCKHPLSEVLTRRVSALLDDLALFASRIVILRDVSRPFSGKILMVHIVAKRKKIVWSVFN